MYRWVYSLARWAVLPEVSGRLAGSHGVCLRGCIVAGLAGASEGLLCVPVLTPMQ